MRKQFPLLFLLIEIGALGFNSCKKEVSCENCMENNIPPVAVAGTDKAITLPTDSVLLDGRASTDPDGAIVEWTWSKIAGPFAFSTINTSVTMVTNLQAGIYQVELMVRDNRGAIAKDTVQIQVNNPVISNRPPIADAGIDQTIILPVNSSNLDGRNSSDPDNNITGYQWSKISGPTPFTISHSQSAETAVTALGAGVYLFQLIVTDAAGLIDKDTVQLSVLDLPPACSDCDIVFVSDRNGNTEIYSCNMDGSNIRRLTNHPGVDEQPVWSPDGTKIAFISERTGLFDIYVMNADGSNLSRKTFSGNCFNPRWSPDGQKIAFSTTNNGSSDIWMIDLISGATSAMLEYQGYDDYATWSPDGSRIAWVSDWAAFDLVYDIYTINANGTGFRALTGNIFDQLDYIHPTWSPDGSRLAMAIIQRSGLNEYVASVGIMNADGGNLVAVKPGAVAWMKISWSHSGNRIFYTSHAGFGKNIAWISPDGSLSGTIVTNAWNADIRN